MPAANRPAVQSLAQRWSALEPQCPPNARPLVRAVFYAGASTALDVIALPPAPPSNFNIVAALQTFQTLVDRIHQLEAELAVHIQLSKAKG